MASTRELLSPKLVRSAAAVFFAFQLHFSTLLAQPVTDEYRLKAAFVLRFPQFVEWPATALDKRETLELCVLRPNPFGMALDELANGETLGDRRLVVRDIDSDEAVDTCHVLYLPGSSAARAAVLRRASLLPVLTVSDAPKFLDEGGIVQLRVFQNRIRFDINAIAAERASVRLSSQLLRLALTVRGEEP